MNSHITSSEEGITIKKGDKIIADFQAVYSGDIIEGEIDEDYEFRLTSYDLIELATWLLEKAKERAREENI